MARTYSRGLAYLSAEDLIQEAYVKLLSGDRVFPRRVPVVTVVINAIHSEASNCREREKSGAIDHRVDVSAKSQNSEEEEGLVVVIPKDEVTPDLTLGARRELSAIEALVADDADLQDLVVVWSLELRGKEAAEYLEWEMGRYEAARKRLVRRLGTINKEQLSGAR